MSEQTKPSGVDAAIQEAAARRAAAAQKHPGIQAEGQPGSPEPFPTDADDKPVYSTRQMQRLLQNEREAAGGGAAAPTAPAGAGIQTASIEVLQREIQRRRDLAMGKLKDIPTDWLEIELERRRAANGEA